jgi:ADP-heptose:LPS heptosyltransferase
MNLNTTKKIDYYVGWLLIIIFSPISFLLNLIIILIPNSFFRKNIVFFKFVGGGSLLIAAPSIYAIKKRYPDYKLVLLCSPSVKPFAEILGVFDEIFLIEINSLSRFLVTILKSFHQVFLSSFFINLEIHSKLSSIYTLITFSNKRISLYSAYNTLQFGLINQPIFQSPYNPIFEGYKNICDLLGAPRVIFSEYQLFFQKINNIVNKKSCLHAIAPFCSDIYPERELNSTQIISILNSDFIISELKCFILGAPKDIDKSFLLQNEFNRIGLECTNLVGKTSLREVLNVFSEIDSLITIDSGLLHLARLAGIKTISYWGPSDPFSRLDGLSNKDKIIYKRLSCSPCVHTLDISPCKGDNLCIQQYFKKIPKNIFWKIR